ncbi:hypothetical protein [Alkalicoccus chagannorensis]|uniref:hypothetical protein n=1 Tax=Alkalicoccus chagannorensis TaxID=427072 RepID=UPI0004040F59|nr:hypothetical protein [Alkalicoccus chagannorensis]
MQWLYLLTAVIMSIISIYHLFTDRVRRINGSEVFFTPDDAQKVSTSSLRYKISLLCSYVVILLSVFLIIEVFNNFVAASILAVLVFAAGTFILLTLDKVFQLQGDAIVFAGYHAKWSKIRVIKWGRARKNRQQLIMELQKGQKIKTTIADEAKEEVEEVLSSYVHFEKEQPAAST